MYKRGILILRDFNGSFENLTLPVGTEEIVRKLIFIFKLDVIVMEVIEQDTGKTSFDLAKLPAFYKYTALPVAGCWGS